MHLQPKLVKQRPIRQEQRKLDSEQVNTVHKNGMLNNTVGDLIRGILPGARDSRMQNSRLQMRARQTILL